MVVCKNFFSLLCPVRFSTASQKIQRLTKLSQGGTDYLLALKDVHPQLREGMGLWLDSEADKGALAVQEKRDSPVACAKA